MAEEGPKRFGRCEVKSKLGEGAMGDIYLAEHTTLGIPVAVKVPRIIVTEDKHFVSRFLREAQVAARLHHRSIVRVYDCGEEDGRYYIVMDYVEGHTCKERLETSGRFEWQEAVRIALEVADALRYAAAEGVIHRDIKPSNIMIDTSGIPRIMDLGLAKVELPGGAHLTHTEDMLGTPFYVSPEQIRNPHEVDFRTDIYSLGTTLYHLICGEVPFDGSGIYEIMNLHLNQPPAPLQTKVPGIAEPICDVIAKMMAKNPYDRYDSYDDLIDDLNRALVGQDVSAAPSEAGLEEAPPARPAAPPMTRVGLFPPGLPAPVLSAVGGLFGFLALFAAGTAGLLVFSGLRQTTAPVLGWGFVLAALGGEAAYVLSLLRPKGAPIGPEAENESNRSMFLILRDLAEWLELPVPRLYVKRSEEPDASSYALGRKSLVICVPAPPPTGRPGNEPAADAEKHTILARELGRFCYGHSTLLTLLRGPLAVFSIILKPLELLCGLDTDGAKPLVRTARTALALGYLLVLGALVGLALYGWFWGGLALVLFLIAGLSGQALARCGEAAADLFAAASLGDTAPVKTLVLKEALRRPQERRMLLRQVGIEDLPALGRGDDPSQSRAPDRNLAAKLADHFSETKWPGGLVRQIRELLAQRPAPGRRVNALAGLVARLHPVHRLIGGVMTALGGMVGVRDAQRAQLLPEPDRITPHAAAGLAGGALTAIAALVLARVGAGDHYLWVFLLLCGAAAALGVVGAIVFLR